MNLVKVAGNKLGGKGVVGAPEKIVDKVSGFKVNEEGRLVNFKVKEIGLEGEEGDFQRIVNLSKMFFQEAERNVFLGGDHSITLPIMKGFSLVHDNPGIVIFDAHADCRSDLGLVEGDLVLGLVKQGMVRKENIILVGVRNWSSEEIGFLKKEGIRYFNMHEIGLEGKYEVSEAVMAIAKNFGALYVSVDVDVLDPGFVCCAGLEPGGMSVRELLFFLQRLKRLSNFRGGDIVEVDSRDEKTVLVGAKIAGEMG